jgi:uncharacterized membrane protein YeaQ/YmgE (transglycosylase-associated protein family)
VDPITLITWLVVGLIVGAIARFIVPGPDPMGWIGTIILGIVGSFVGGFLASLLFAGQAIVQPAGWVDRRRSDSPSRHASGLMS